MLSILPVKALTVLQPFAWAIAHGGKQIENRSWPTQYRGPLLIHAGRSRRLLSLPWPPEYGVELPPERKLVFGAIVAVAEIVDCVPFMFAADDPWALGQYCWQLANVRPLVKPVPCLGAQSLWRVPVDVLDRVHVTNPNLFASSTLAGPT